MIFFISRAKKSVLLFVAMLIYFIGSTYANEEDKWVFAASQFDSNIENDATAKLIPQYILQNFSTSTKRTLSSDEQLRMAEQVLDNELTTLYESLQKKIFEKDSLLVSQKNYKDILEEQDEITIEIEKILMDIQEVKDKKSLLKLDSYAPREIPIALWGNSTGSLYDVPSDTAYFYPKDLQALITGNIEYVDSFVHVSVNLSLYPGSIKVAEISEVESINAIENLAQRIANKLYFFLINKQEIEITFDIEPKDALEASTIYINGSILKYQENEGNYFARLNLTNDIYEFYVDSPGYDGVSVTHSFLEETSYMVSIQLKQQNITNLSFSIPSSSGDIFLNTQMAEKGDEDSKTTEGVVLVNGLPALGEFVNKEGITTWFFLDSDTILKTDIHSDEYTFSFQPDTKSFEDVIEKNRKRMYNSYAALLVSLPLYFIANGQYLNEYNSWASGKASGDNIQIWQTARDVTMGVSIGLGINLLVQLGIYIYSVNSILPEEASATH